MSDMTRDILAIIICFKPNHERLRGLIDAISGSVGRIVLFDNGGLDVAKLACTGAEKIQVESPGENVGLATALNFACEYGAKNGYRFLISFDQDSTPPAEMIPILERELLAYQAKNARAIAIGPQLVDVRDGKEMISPFVRFGKIGISKWSGDGTEPVSQLITSGCMVDLSVWGTENRFNDELFIDYVDNNWCWRMTRKKYLVLGTSRARMPHELSEEIKESSYISLNKYGWIRRYFQMRNGVYHLAHESLSLAQRLYVLRAMIVVFLSSVISDERPLQSVWQCMRGAAHGLVGRMGAYR
ncbi:rhamnosyltransferase [Paraburkholderia phenazinium]|jgi:rhamnosyltransferase|uniref:Rhamnosyltransferase n=2 Tax=Paraburkholderia phenazinium TaxID=60549 RepID=A0A1G8HXW0_9BURK|nr:rhamnosyltransferase [Paraburkholderia phenazinium]